MMKFNDHYDTLIVVRKPCFARSLNESLSGNSSYAVRGFLICAGRRREDW